MSHLVHRNSHLIRGSCSHMIRGSCSHMIRGSCSHMIRGSCSHMIRGSYSHMIRGSYSHMIILNGSYSWTLFPLPRTKTTDTLGPLPVCYLSEWIKAFNPLNPQHGWELKTGADGHIYFVDHSKCLLLT